MNMVNICVKCAQIVWKLYLNIHKILKDPGKNIIFYLNHQMLIILYHLLVINFFILPLYIYLFNKNYILGAYFARFDHKFYDAAGTNYRDQLWTVSLAYRLLQNNPNVLSLMGHRQLEPAPKYVRAILYKFKYTKVSER